MQEPTIECPNCSAEIKLTESLAGPLLSAAKDEYETKLKATNEKFNIRENQLKLKEANLKQAQDSIDEKVEAQLEAQLKTVAADEKRKAQATSAAEIKQKALELAELKTVLNESNEKLAEAQKTQANLLKKERLLDDQKRELELTVEKRVQSSVAIVREKAKQEVEGELKLKVSEKEEQISSMQRQIEELRRKSEQGSQQLQGEVMELELEQELATKFPHDSIEPVPKGEFGGDVMQKVLTPNGIDCGAILWEAKRTKNWSNAWLAKLRNDQRVAKAGISILVTKTLPKEIETFGLLDGVWVSSPQYSISLVIALRHTLTEIALNKQMKQGQETKMELVYDYLTGSGFRHRVEAIVEKFSDMQSDLDKEKKAMTRLWAKRQVQINSVVESTAGMYGDLQGIAGRAIQEIEGLELPMLETDADD